MYSTDQVISKTESGSAHITQPDVMIAFIIISKCFITNTFDAVALMTRGDQEVISKVYLYEFISYYIHIYCGADKNAIMHSSKGHISFPVKLQQSKGGLK